jgi:ATP-dependent exoDNAse (exonuclease V) beta subunit
MKALKNFYVLKSSAGSGKTYALVKHYLQLALATDIATGYKHILAITFTNAAAAEMKERVIKRLREFRSPIDLESGDKALFEEIRSTLDVPKHVLHYRAEKTLEHMLHNYGLISISTIDSFTHRIVRSFARDLRLHPDFSIEMDTSAFSEKIVDACLDQIGTDAELTRYLEQFTLENYEDEEGQKVRTALENIAGQLYNEDAHDVVTELQRLSLDEYTAIRRKLRQKIEDFEKPLIEASEHVQLLLDSMGLTPDDFSNKKSGALGFFLKTLQGNIEAPGKRLTEESKGSRWYTKTAAADVIHRIESIADELERMREIVMTAFTPERFAEYKLAQDASKVIYSMGMLARLGFIASQLKEEENILLINDFQTIISEIIEDSPAPFIYERVGERYNHILFDEFQDTSGLQWNNFLPLIENALSKGHFNLIVGDGKQAIYRWRNGKAEQFVNLPELDGKQAPERKQALKYNYEKGELKKNFRSNRAVVRFNNELYHALVEAFPHIQHVYEGQEQEEVRQAEGYVQAVIIPKPEEGDKKELINSTIVAKVKESIEDGYAPGDIAILTRKGAKESGPIAAALHAAGYEVVTKESFLLSNSPKVRLVMAFMRYLVQPDHIYSHIGVWQNLAILFPEQFRLQQLIDTFGIREEKKMVPEFDRFLQTHFPGYANISAMSTAIEIAEATLKLFHISKDPFLEFLLDHLTRLSTQRDHSIQDIMDWWEDKRESLYTSSQSGTNAVNILTVHKSKGLQYPVVIYPRFETKSPGNKVWVDVDEDELGISKMLINNRASTIREENHPQVNHDIEQGLLDDINLAYVATTRAEDRLYLITEEVKTGITAIINNYVTSNLVPNEHSVYEFGLKEKNARTPKPVEQPEWIRGEQIENISSLKLRYTKTGERQLEGQEQRMLGNIIHECLSMIRVPADISGALKKVMPGYPSIAQSRFDELATLLLHIVEHPSFRRWFDGGLTMLNEKEIILPTGHPVRPDRVIVHDEYWEVVDFKTGKPHVKHHDQVRGYMEQLASISGMRIEGYLAYTSDAVVVPVEAN